MVSLQNQVRWCARAQLLLWGLLLVVGTAFYCFGYRPEDKRLRALSAQIAAERQEVVDNASKSENLKDVTKEVRKLRGRLAGKELPADPDVWHFINDLTQISEKTQLQKPQYKPKDKLRRGDLFSEYTIALQLKGSFMNIFSFINETERLSRLTRVKTITLRADPANPGTVLADLDIDLYFKSDQ